MTKRLANAIVPMLAGCQRKAIPGFSFPCSCEDMQPLPPGGLVSCCVWLRLSQPKRQKFDLVTNVQLPSAERLSDSCWGLGKPREAVPRERVIISEWAKPSS